MMLPPNSILIHLGIILLYSLLLLSGFARLRRYRKPQEKLIKEFRYSNDGRLFRVNVARPSYFPCYFKSFFEAKGVLIDGPEKVRVVAETPTGERIDRSFSRENLNPRLLDNKFSTGWTFKWMGVGSLDDYLMIAADARNNWRQRQENADLWRVLTFPDLPPDLKSDFALEKNVASLTAVIAFFSVILYAACDGLILIHYEVISHLSPVAFLVPGVAILGQCLWMFRKRVPPLESLSLAAFLVMAVAIAAIPAEKRLGLTFLHDGAKTISYRIAPGRTFMPLAADAPSINFIDSPEYWEQFNLGSEHNFDLIRGGFGLILLDRRKLDEEQNKFYRSRKEESQ